MTMVSMTICQPGLCPKLLGHRNRACSSGFLISAEAPIHPAAQGKPAWLPPSPQATIQSMSSPGDLPGSSSETYLPPASPQRMLPPELGCLQRASESCIPAGRWGKGAQEFVAFWESNQTKRMTTSLSSGSNSLQLTSLDRPGRLQANENSRGPRIKRGWGRRETLLRKQRPPDSSSPSFPSRCELQACKHPPTSSPSLAVGAGARDQFYPHNSGQSCALAHPSITSFINFSLSTGSFQLSKGRRSPIQNKTSFHLCCCLSHHTLSLLLNLCTLRPTQRGLCLRVFHPAQIALARCISDQTSGPPAQWAPTALLSCFDTVFVSPLRLCNIQALSLLPCFVKFFLVLLLRVLSSPHFASTASSHHEFALARGLASSPVAPQSAVLGPLRVHSGSVTGPGQDRYRKLK